MHTKALTIALMLASLLYVGCTTLPTVRGLMGKPEAPTARDHLSKGGEQSLTMPDGTKLRMEQGDNPQAPATIRYRRITTTVKPPPPPVGPQSSVAVDPLNGFATVPPMRLIGFLGFGKKEDPVQQPPPVTPPAPEVQGGTVLPDGSIVVTDKIEVDTTLSGAQETALIVNMVLSRKEAFLHAIIGLIVAFIGWSKANAKYEQDRWPLIGWGLLIGGTGMVYGTIMETSWALWCLPAAVAWTAIVYFVYQTTLGKAVAAGAVTALSAASPLAGGIAGSILVREPKAPANQPPPPTS